MRRKGGVALVTNERRVLAAALALLEDGQNEFHGYQLVQAFRTNKKLNVAMSTLYRCLARLEERSMLEGEWRTPEDDPGGRPIRMYHLTPDGVEAAREQSAEIEFADGTVRLISD